MTTMRTALQWLLEHDLDEQAEVWVLSKPHLEPVAALESIDTTAWVGSTPVESDDALKVLRWADFYARLASWYSAAGTFRWAQHPDMVYRGSYVVNPKSAVFLLFLAPNVELILPHQELMDIRREQASKLTQEIENAWQR